MTKNPLVMALAGLLIGLTIGYVLAERQGRVVAPPAKGDPHAGVPGAPPLSSPAEQGPAGSPAPAANARLLEQLREIEALLAQDPENYQHRVQLGNTYYDLGDFLRAIDAYERARQLRDDSADVLTDLGVCYRETGQPRRALEAFDKAAALDPRHWQSRYNAAVVYLFDLDDAAGAAVMLEKLKAIEPAPPQMPDLAGLEAEIAKRRR